MSVYFPGRVLFFMRSMLWLRGGKRVSEPTMYALILGLWLLIRVVMYAHS